MGTGRGVEEAEEEGRERKERRGWKREKRWSMMIC